MNASNARDIDTIYLKRPWLSNVRTTTMSSLTIGHMYGFVLCLSSSNDQTVDNDNNIQFLIIIM